MKRVAQRCCNRRYACYFIKGLFVRFHHLHSILYIDVLVYGWTEFGVFITGMGFADVATLFLLIGGFVTLCYSEKGEWREMCNFAQTLFKDILFITYNIKMKILASLVLGDFKNFLIPPRI